MDTHSARKLKQHQKQPKSTQPKAYFNKEKPKSITLNFVFLFPFYISQNAFINYLGMNKIAMQQRLNQTLVLYPFSSLFFFFEGKLKLSLIQTTLQHSTITAISHLEGEHTTWSKTQINTDSSN